MSLSSPLPPEEALDLLQEAMEIMLTFAAELERRPPTEAEKHLLRRFESQLWQAHLAVQRLRLRTEVTSRL